MRTRQLLCVQKRKTKKVPAQIENSLVGIEDEAVIKLHCNRGNIQDSYEIRGSDLQSLREAESQWNWWYHLAVKYRKNYMAFLSMVFHEKKRLDYTTSKVLCRKMLLCANCLGMPLEHF